MLKHVFFIYITLNVAPTVGKVVLKCVNVLHKLFFTPVAVFSLNQSVYNVTEESGEVLVCVELSGELDRDISLVLSMENDTASFMDFDNTISTYTFESGSTSQNTSCNSVNITRDGIVEDEERFVIFLQTLPQEPDDVSITLSRADVLIADSPFDSKLRI